jgi:hypothetical protein
MLQNATYLHLVPQLLCFRARTRPERIERFSSIQ